MIWLVGYILTAFLLGFFLEFKVRTSEGWEKAIGKIYELFFLEHYEKYDGLDEWCAFGMGMFWPLALLNIFFKCIDYVAWESICGVEKLMNWAVSKHKNK